MPDDTPIGPEVDATPRGLPARIRLRGRYVELEPLHRRHVPELWQTMQGTDGDWSYLGYGPFASEAALARFVDDFSTTHDPMVWAIRPVATGVATGWLALLDIQPRNAVVELGHGLGGFRGLRLNWTFDDHAWTPSVVPCEARVRARTIPCFAISILKLLCS